MTRSQPRDAHRPTRRYEYIADGPAIYAESFATIRREADLSRVPPDAEKLAVRMIHGSGQPDLTDDLVIHPGLVPAARAALQSGAPICAMHHGRHGCHRGPTPAGNEVLFLLTTRACRLVARAVEHHPDRRRGLALGTASWRRLVAVGNAPTALFHLLEMILDGAPRPAAIVGCPVGFIGAAESKRALVACRASTESTSRT